MHLEIKRLPLSLFVLLGIPGIFLIYVLSATGIKWVAASNGPNLAIPNQIPVSPSSTVVVPVTFTSNGNSISSTIFSIDYDQNNLSFDDTDSNGDGIPDTVTFNTPATFSVTALFDSTDTDGEIDVVIADLTPPFSLLSDGVIVEITLSTQSVQSPVEAPVIFSNEPLASFGDNQGFSVPGTADGGSVLIGGGLPSATNTSSPTPSVTAGPTSSSTPSPTSTSTSTNTPSPTISPSPTLPPSGAGPLLAIQDRIPADPSSTVVVPITFFSDGNNIASLIFSVDYDETSLSLDGTDADSDGIPDAIALNLPTGYFATVPFDPTDTDGEIEFVIGDFTLPFSSLPDGDIVEITFQTLNIPTPAEAPVNFANDPPASFGNDEGKSVQGTTDNGSVLIGGGVPGILRWFSFLPFIKRDPTPTPTNTPTPTPTFTPTPTSTPGFCSNLIINGGFEQDKAWSIPDTQFTAGYSTVKAHNGNRSMRTGILNKSDNIFSYSSARQTVTIPANIASAKLRAWLYLTSQDQGVLSLQLRNPFRLNTLEAVSDNDLQMVLVLEPGPDLPQENILKALFLNQSNDQSWQRYEFNLKEFAGETIKLYFGTFNNGTSGVTSMFVDDVVVEVCTQ